MIFLSKITTMSTHVSTSMSTDTSITMSTDTPTDMSKLTSESTIIVDLLYVIMIYIANMFKINNEYVFHIITEKTILFKFLYGETLLEIKIENNGNECKIHYYFSCYLDGITHVMPFEFVKNIDNNINVGILYNYIVSCYDCIEKDINFTFTKDNKPMLRIDDKPIWNKDEILMFKFKQLDEFTNMRNIIYFPYNFDSIIDKFFNDLIKYTKSFSNSTEESLVIGNTLSMHLKLFNLNICDSNCESKIYLPDSYELIITKGINKLLIQINILLEDKSLYTSNSFNYILNIKENNFDVRITSISIYYHLNMILKNTFKCLFPTENLDFLKDTYSNNNNNNYI